MLSSLYFGGRGPGDFRKAVFAGAETGPAVTGLPSPESPASRV
jgi:hypothetical protein